jgi:hypothetical protein
MLIMYTQAAGSLTLDRIVREISLWRELLEGNHAA